MIHVFLCLEIFLSVAAVLCLLLPPPARGDVDYCCASLVCLFSLSWNTCGFSAQCLAAGGPSGVPLRADSGWLLSSCSCGSLGVGGGCLVTVGLFPPCFLFCACAASPSGFCPLTEWVGMSVSSLLVYSYVWLEGFCCAFFLSACALFSVLQVRWDFWASPAPLCWGSWGFTPCLRVFLLRCGLLGLQVGFPAAFPLP